MENKLNLSSSNKNNFNNSYVSRLSAIKSNYEYKQENDEKERKDLQKQITDRSKILYKIFYFI